MRRAVLGPDRTGIWFEGDFRTWEEAASRCSGYADGAILDKVLGATRKVILGEAAFERDSVAFDRTEYSWPLLAGLMWAAARTRGRLSVLDLGGALGSSYFQNRKFLQAIPEVRWHVVEQPHYAEAGRINVHEEHLFFYETIEASALEDRPNVIVLSSVLQYLPDPHSLLRDLLRVEAETIILDRTSYSTESNKDVIKIQHVPRSIYLASYPCRFFVEDDLLEFFKANGYHLLEAFDSLDRLHSSASWKGHIFSRKVHP